MRFREPDDSKLPRVTLPLKASGHYYIVGWDGPTYWAVDGEGVFWEDNGHGFPLEPFVRYDLGLGSRKYKIEVIHSHPEIQDALVAAWGFKQPMPSWIRAALYHKWTPPAGFDATIYDPDL